MEAANLTLNGPIISTTEGKSFLFWTKHSILLNRLRRIHFNHYFYVTLRLWLRVVKPLSLLLLSAVCLSVIIFLVYDEFPIAYHGDILVDRRREESKLNAMLAIDHGSCAMPVLDPFAPEVMQFSRPAPEIFCQGIDWVECSMTECRVIRKVLRSKRFILCSYRDITFVDDYRVKLAPAIKISGNDTYPLGLSDNVKVTCTGNGNYGPNFIPDHWFGYKAGFRKLRRRLHNHSIVMNVIVIIFHSISRIGFIRQLPKSYEVLHEELGAVILNRYNIVGDGALSALMPLLTGHTILEMPDWRKTANNSGRIDKTSFLFDVLKNEGFRTAFFEDMPGQGPFQSGCNGFEKPPADHYLRPLFIASSQYGDQWWKGRRERHCIGSKPGHVFMLNLTSQFFKMDGKKFGVTYISSLSHGDPNMISAADDDLASFLREYRDNEMMQDSLLFVLSDHGPSVGDIRDTHQGAFEERLPMAAIALPRLLGWSFPRAREYLQGNAGTLATAFDVHTTILHALGLAQPRAAISRGLSLLEPMLHRSCAEAGVALHWCACASWRALTTDDNMRVRVANVIANYVNQLTAGRRSVCVERKLVTIESVLRYTPPDEDLVSNNTRSLESTPEKRLRIEFYQAKIIMDPAVAIYEGTVMYNVTKDSFVEWATDISRINAYGRESSCVSKREPKLNKFCYCK